MKPMVGMLRTLGFGLMAALGVIAWQLAFGPWFGHGSAFASYAVLCACAFPLAIAPSLRAAFLAAALCAPLGVLVLVLAPDPSSALIGAALIAAGGRALCYRAQPARTIALEITLLVSALAAARLCGSGGPFGFALGLWLYFLVQSAFFLFLQPQPREAAAPAADPFDDAHARALTLLERR